MTDRPTTAEYARPGGATMGRWAEKQLPGAYAEGKMPPLVLTSSEQES